MKQKISPRDLRYVGVQRLIEHGDITLVHEIFEILPRTVFAKNLGKNYNTLVDKIDDPERFGFKDISVFAAVFNVSEEKVYAIIQSSIRKKKSES